MPILRNNTKICHFVHIPKCGGSSIEDYCLKIGIKIAFFDKCFVTAPPNVKWNISSPQHIDAYSFSRLFPPAFFDLGFAVVRDPVKRFVSAFKFQYETEKKIPAGTNINDFIRNDLYNISRIPGVFDNHFLPQVYFFLPSLKYQIFRLEDGLENVKHFVDQSMLGTDSPAQIGHINTSQTGRPLAAGTDPFHIEDDALGILRQIYHRDYETMAKLAE